MTNKAHRVRTARGLVQLLQQALRTAARKRRMGDQEFRVTLSHKHATVRVTPAHPEVLADREVRDIVKRIENLLQKNR